MNLKKKNVIKKLLLCAGLVFSIIASVVLIIINSIAYRTDSPYTIKNSFQTNSIEVRIILNNDGRGVATYLLNGVPQGSESEFKYTVSNGSMYIFDEDLGEYKLSGSISSSRLQFSIDGVTLLFQNDNTVLINTMAIIILVLGICSISTFIVWNYFDKKKTTSDCSNENAIETE